MKKEYIDGENPFLEEFSKEDVVNKEEQKVFSNSSLSSTKSYNDEYIVNMANVELDQKSLDSYDIEKMKSKKFNLLTKELKEETDNSGSEDERLRDSFQNNVDTIDEEKLTEQEILQRNFQDFLVLKKISGNLEGYPHKSLITSDKIHLSEGSIEISDDPTISELNSTKEAPKVVIHKKESEDIEFIEIICTCGERTVIKFDYEESLYPDLDKYQFTELMSSDNDNLNQENTEDED